ncbi:MAG TPA: acyl carrier protein [Streptosporangiaceae bacterium]|jgi:acyl carrier protein
MVNSVGDLVTLVRDELGLPATAESADLRLDQIEGWDSVHMLSLITVIERRTGCSLALADVLSAQSLHEIYELTAARGR